MRLALCTLSAVLLSGCSWLGSMGMGGGQGHQAKSSHYNYNAGAQHGQHQYRAKQDPCQVFSPQAPIPQGCHPSQVTLGTAGGFPQQPNFGGGQYANQGYGSHAGVAHQQAAHYNPRKNKLRKPRFRGSLSLGVEKSVSGNLLDYAKVPTIDPVAGYNPQDFNEGFTSGSRPEGSIVDTTYTANDRDVPNIFQPPGPGFLGYERATMPSISFDDIYSTPARLALGGEYILNPRTTVFANAGYSKAEGKSGKVASVEATLYERTVTEGFTEDPDNPGIFISSGTVTNTSFLPNREIARYAYDFTDMNRIDLEAGARHYLNPVVKSQGFKTLTPFIGASVGASHYNAVSFDVTQEQAFYQRAFQSF